MINSDTLENISSSSLDPDECLAVDVETRTGTIRYTFPLDSIVNPRGQWLQITTPNDKLLGHFALASILYFGSSTSAREFLE